MNHFHTHNTCAVKDVKSVEEVSRPLNEGIVAICNICESLKKAHVSPTTGTCSNYNQIRKHIEDAEQCLKKSETMIKKKLGYLDECMEQLIREKQNAELQKKEKILALNNLLIKKKSAEESLKHSKAALEQAKKSVESANYAIRAHQDRMNTCDDVATAGTVLLAIPIIGWIAGPIMISEGERGFEEASNALRDAEWEKQIFQSQVRNCNEKVLHYERIISRAQTEIEQTGETLKRTGRKIEEVQKHLTGTAGIQQMVRRVVNLLSVLSGRVTVLERQTQRFILWQPVVKAMEDVMKAVVNIAQNRLLYSNGAPGLINTLKENVRGLLALCSSPSNSEYESYY
ncbi:uncharacterized protein LOC131522001 [Onychostoma macrolepis]|uniref:Uncharacterized protein n=1 Tax=Onychostoma macrolepis TaxID=369639 RepID=A0A7J6C8B0_9TELE|nr:uncharacterized protein LOC131522001 [Onychostoma macrolepis]KAF4103426.1 hypothetical protein G5714_016309 [Onychostoma macrolepis]